MATPSPYRSLPAARRVALVTALIRASRPARATFVQRLMSRGGFRPTTLQQWPAEKLAAEVVRTKSETANDEFDLLHFLYVTLEPAIQITFLDAAGVPHEGSDIADEATTPYTDAAGVERGASAVRAAHGEDGERYLRTLARYASEAWPGIHDLVNTASAPSGPPS